jgi:hypothetical protein
MGLLRLDAVMAGVGAVSFLGKSREVLMRGWARLRNRDAEVMVFRYIETDRPRRMTTQPLPYAGDDALLSRVSERLRSGDLVSDAELRAALRAAYVRGHTEGWSAQGAQRIGHAQDSRDEDPPLPDQRGLRPEPGSDDGQAETPDARARRDLYTGGLVDAAAHDSSQVAEMATGTDDVPVWRRRWLHLQPLKVQRQTPSALRLAETDTPPLESLSPEEVRHMAWETVRTVNDTLARLFLKLGPPPEGAGGDMSPVASDGGGAQQ